MEEKEPNKNCLPKNVQQSKIATDDTRPQPQRAPSKEILQIVNRRIIGANWQNSIYNKSRTTIMGASAIVRTSSSDSSNSNNLYTATPQQHEKVQRALSSPLGKNAKYVALDCEMVGVGHLGQNHMLARVSLVNYHGEVLLDKYVKPRQKVINYRTHVSGIRPGDLENADDFKQVQMEVLQIIRERIIIGHGIEHDLKALEIQHPKYLIRDTSKYMPIRRISESKSTPSLKTLAKIILYASIQAGEHSSVEDARTVMKIYKHFSTNWEISVRQRYQIHLK